MFSGVFQQGNEASDGIKDFKLAVVEVATRFDLFQKPYKNFHQARQCLGTKKKAHRGRVRQRGCQDARKMMKVLQDAVMVRQKKTRKVVVVLLNMDI